MLDKNAKKVIIEVVGIHVCAGCYDGQKIAQKRYPGPKWQSFHDAQPPEGAELRRLEESGCYCLIGLGGRSLPVWAYPSWRIAS